MLVLLLGSDQNNDGFTLFEALCVLLVFSIMATMPVLRYSNWQKQREANQKINQFERLYEKCQQYAIVGGYASLIEVDEANQYISFRYQYPNRTKTEVIEMPSFLVISMKSNNNGTKLDLSGKTGRPSELVTFIFRDYANGIEVKYTVQMTNSKVIRHEKKL